MIDVTTDNLRLLGNSWLACRPKLGRESRERRLAEREGFEPPCRLPGKTLSRRPRYDHFGTSPNLVFYYECAALSRASSRALISSPPANPVSAPLDPMTRWQGATIDRGLRPFAPPT